MYKLMCISYRLVFLSYVPKEWLNVSTYTPVYTVYYIISLLLSLLAVVIFSYHLHCNLLNVLSILLITKVHHPYIE